MQKVYHLGRDFQVFFKKKRRKPKFFAVLQERIPETDFEAVL